MSASLNHSDKSAYHHDKSSRQQWLVVVGLAVLSLILGVIGFMQVGPHPAESPNLLDAIYNSMCLFRMHCDYSARPMPWELQIARFLAPLVLGATVLKGFIYAAHSHRHAFMHRSQSGHVVICGLGQKGLTLARDYRRKQRWVVIIEKDSQNELLSLCEHENIYYIIGDAAEAAVLEEARVEHAREVIVVTPDDETNLRIAMQLCGLVKKGGFGAPECFVHLENIQLRDSLQKHFEREKKDGCLVRFFDVYDSEARRVLAELLLDGKGISKEDKTSVHMAILGFGRMGRSLALRAAQTGHFANGEKLRISILDRVDTPYQRFLFHYPALDRPADKPDAICDLQFHQGIVESLETRKLIKNWALEPDTLLHIFICIDDNTHALEVAFRLQEALVDRPNCKLYVRVKRRESLAAIFDGTQAVDANLPAAGPRIVPFGMVEDTCREESFKNPKDERVAKAIHQRFVDKRIAGSKRRPENDPALRDWEELSDDIRSSNYQQADHIAIKMRAIGCEVVEAADPRPAVERFTHNEQNILAPLEHTRWNAERLLAGWRYGTPSDKARRINENITGWEFLDDSVKKYDYEAIEDIPLILAKASPPQKVVRRKLPVRFRWITNRGNMNPSHPSKIFISYSHGGRGLEWKDRLLKELAVFEKHHLLDVWHDDETKLGAEWHPLINATMGSARLAVLLLTDEFLKSPFVLQHELPELQRRHKEEGLIVAPILCEKCDWEADPWVASLQIKPREQATPVPLASLSQANRDHVLRQLATECGKLGGSALAEFSSHGESKTYLDKFPLTRSPGLREEKLIGREQELALLDLAFAQPHTAIVSLVAWGGVGKTMLVQHWLQRLQREGWFGARRVYAWSFYSQGNCIAVGKRAENFFPQAPPPSPFTRRHRQFHGGLSAGMAEHSGGDKQPETQTVDRDFFLPAQMPLKQDRQIVSQAGQAQGGLGRPKLFQAQRRQGKTLA